MLGKFKNNESGFFDIKKKLEYIEYIDENQLFTIIDSKNKNELEIKEKEFFLDWIINNRRSFGISIFLLTNCTSEGNQFVKGFGGIGGILRYEINNIIPNNDN